MVIVERKKATQNTRKKREKGIVGWGALILPFQRRFEAGKGHAQS